VFGSLSLPWLILIFLAAAVAIWLAGIRLSDTTDVLSSRLGLGQALGGLILLAIATNLPEIAITFTAAVSHNLGLAIGNILGGIAIQTVVLAALDGFGVRASPLTYRAASLVLVIEGAAVIAMLVVVVMGTRLSPDVIWLHVTPPGIALLALWLASLWLVGRARSGLPWHEAGNPPDGQAEPRGMAHARKDEAMTRRGRSTAWVAGVFSVAALVTLGGGVVLEESSNGIADHLGLSGVLFGATFLAAATALPEISTGLAALKLGDYQLAVSDIFGGNAFLPVLFLLATLVSGEAVLPRAADSDVYLTALGGLLTVFYICGLLFRPSRQWLRLGPDSILVVVAYALGIVGLVWVTHG
jgi:cation:H+ antiporter